MDVAILLESAEELESQLRFPLRLATARAGEVALIVPAPRAEEVARVSLDPSAEVSEARAGVVAAVRKALDACLPDAWEPAAGEKGEPDEEGQEGEEAQEEARVRVALHLVPSGQGEAPGVLGIVRDLHVKLLIEVVRALEGEDAPSSRRRQLLFRDAPCEVALVRPGHDQDGGILAPVGWGAHNVASLRMARDLALARNQPVVAMRVQPPIGPETEQVGHRVLDRIVRRALGAEPEIELRRLIVLDDQPHRGITETAQEGGYAVVVLGASRRSAIGEKLRGSVPKKVVRSVDGPTVVVLRAALPIRDRVAKRLEHAVRHWVPQLERDERVALVERVQSNSYWDFDFVALTALSTLIAALGLIDDSTAVIIGAMLVAPLMTPLLGLGVAVVQGNPALMRLGLRSVVLGFLTSYAIALGLALLQPDLGHATPEMLLRSWPRALDFFVALVSGVAAAYASSRPGLLAALPGVAIAAALVPPIATAGLASGLGDWNLASGAVLLFVTNMTAIVLGAASSLWAVGMRYARIGSVWRQVAGGALVTASVVLALWLTFAPPKYTPPVLVPEDFVSAASAELGPDFRLRDVRFDESQEPPRVVLSVGGAALPSPETTERLLALARRHLDPRLALRIETLLEIDVR